MPHSNEHFSVLNASYCPSSDTNCTRCREHWIASFSAREATLLGVTNYSCVGQGGCICTAYCELRDTRGIKLSDQHNSFRDTTCSTSKFDAVPGTSIIGYTLLVTGGVLLVLFVREVINKLLESTFAISWF